MTKGVGGEGFGTVIFGGVLLFLAGFVVWISWIGLKAILFGFLLRPVWACGNCHSPIVDLSLGLFILIPLFKLLLWIGGSVPGEETPNPNPVSDTFPGSLFVSYRRKVIIGIFALMWLLSATSLAYDYWIGYKMAQNFQTLPAAIDPKTINSSANESPKLSGRVLVCNEKFEVNPNIMAGLPSELRALELSEVQSVIMLHRELIVVGKYAKGGPAYQVKMTAKVLDWPTKTTIGSKTFLGGQPSTSISRSSLGTWGSNTGDDPDILEILNWIQSMPK